MRIVSYNLNGIRAAIRKGFLEWVKNSNIDVICLQEVKADKTQVDEQILENVGFPHRYWFSAHKKGYSGVAIFTKKKPLNIEYGIGISNIDNEGRNLRVDFEDLSVMSVYLPSGSNPDRVSYKFQYMDSFYNYIKALIKTTPSLILCGDFNVCHRAIDIHDPIRNAKVSGFLPEERQWLTKFLELGFIDSFRHFNKNPHNYSWWSYRANSRTNNKGWRIDYQLAHNSLASRLEKSNILSNVVHSDHCPIEIQIN